MMVTLIIDASAHTIGIAHCSFFNDKLYNFLGMGKANPTMDPTLVTKLNTTCPYPTSRSFVDPLINLDQGTPSVFYNSFFKKIVAQRGILQIDQQLFEDSTTTNFVRSYTGSSPNSPLNFNQ
jgi:peroxidase